MFRYNMLIVGFKKILQNVSVTTKSDFVYFVKRSFEMQNFYSIFFKFKKVIHINYRKFSKYKRVHRIK